MRPALAVVIVLGTLGTGCGYVNKLGPSTCDRSASDNPPLLYTEGEVDGNVYKSAEVDCAGRMLDKSKCELLYFPGGMRYQIEHKLTDSEGAGVVPDWWQFELSFDQYGAETGTLAPAAGDSAQLTDINEKDLVVVNGTCAEYWLLVIAGTGLPPDAGTADAGSD